MREGFSYGIENIDKIFSLPLKIPNYQRPYKWSKEHTSQLLEDLFAHFQESRPYRIGTIVLHQDNDLLNIVDGQQRITTLAILLHFLKENNIAENFLSDERYFHSESIEHLKENAEIIEYFVQYNAEFKDSFYDFILKKCSMVYVKLTSLEEAFQFFDSQNARGKSLAPYDLLKAYHLRSLSIEKSSEVLDCVEKWENAVSPTDGKGSLDLIISKLLFRLRQWHLGNDGEIFNNKDIDIFKGVNEECVYPYLATSKASLALFNMSKQNPFIYKSHLPFNIQQTIINGKSFFWFVEHYRNLENKLFNSKNGELLNYSVQNNQNYIDFTTNYKGSDRTGDRYVQNLFKCAVLAYYDKFAEDGLDIALDRALRWAFSLRLEHQSVRYRTIENEGKNRNGLLTLIVQAKEPKDILRYIPPKVKEAKCTKADELKTFFGVKKEHSNERKN
ncbi:DUF262 domain-containing protein [Bisgaard Taxon 46]